MASILSFPSPASSAQCQYELKGTKWKLRNACSADVAGSSVNIPTASVARTIPGLRNAHGSVAQNAIRSERLKEVNGRNTAHPDRNRVHAAIRRTLAAVVPPLAPTAPHRWRVLLNMLAAYSVVFLSLLIVHIPFVISSGARSLMRAGEVFRTDLVSSHLGQLVLYGALITLLSYTEGLFADVEASSWYEHGLIAVKIALWATLVVGVGLRLCGIDVDAGALVTAHSPRPVRR